MDKQELAPELLRKLLIYRAETGELVWRARPIEMFAGIRSMGTWNTRYAGGLALNKLNSKGYRAGTLFGRTVTAHRVIWAIVHGEWPTSCIDHINGHRSDNRIGNLRAASYSQNSRNRRLNRNSTTGVCGVKAAPKGRWAAHIRTFGKFHYLGAFDTIAQAAQARREAEKRLGFTPKGELAHG